MPEVSPPLPAVPKEQFGRYRLLKTIGRGAMGVVYAAYDDVVGRTVALKVLMADLEADPETSARFSQEARAAARLVHPNVVTIYDAGTENGRSFFAMQLLDGADLATHLARPENGALEHKLDLMVQICEGLAAAHAEGIVHRDLKPSNLFVQSDGLLKILDFGVARLADSRMTVPGVMIGTPDYMSPEQARGDAVDVRSDIFSVGAVFHVMLSGRKPFGAADLPAVLHQLQFGEPAPLPADTPPELGTIVTQALAKRASDRPPRIENLLGSLVRFRRQYQAETRRLISAARAEFTGLEHLAGAVRDLSTNLGLEARGDQTGSIRQRFPALSPAGAVELASFDRSRVMALLNDLETERARLGVEQSTLKNHLSSIEQGERVLAAGDAVSALRLFEGVAAAVPESTRAAQLVEDCRAEAGIQRATQERLTLLVAAAAGAVATEAWHLAIEKCEEALSLVPEHPPALALLAQAEQALEAERTRRAARFRELSDDASAALTRGDLDAADQLVRQAEALDPAAVAASGLRRRLGEARASAAAAALLEELSADEVRQARSAFRRARYDEAIQRLRTFLEIEPKAPHVEAELERLSRIRDRIVSVTSGRRTRARDLLSATKPLVDRGAVAQALALAREAFHLDRADPDVVATVDDLFDRELQQRITAERARTGELRRVESEQAMASAREALRRGYLAFALEFAVTAARLHPDWDEAGRLVAELKKKMGEDDAQTSDLAEDPLTTEPTRPAGPTSIQPAGPARTSPPALTPPAAEPAIADPAGQGLLHHVSDWFRRRPDKA